MRSLRILVGCEFSGIVREVFRRLGHRAESCDLLPTEIPGPHYLGSVLDIIDEGWDMGIFHPPCTYLCSSGLHWNKRRPERAAQTEEALEFVRVLLAAPMEKIALENPVGCISTKIRPYDQMIQPYNFGDDASKQTCLWLKNLPLLGATQFVEPRIVGGKQRWANQTDSGQNNLPPSEDRWAIRSRTFPGIAEAMAQQWAGRVTSISVSMYQSTKTKKQMELEIK